MTTHFQSEPLKIGDHPALDFLNTEIMEDGKLTDRLQTDADVLQWLTAIGFDAPRSAPATSLLAAARDLRDKLRKAVIARKAGKRIDWRAWNALAAKSPSYSTISIHDDHPHIEKHWQTDTPEGTLGPVIEASLDLLVSGDFNLIRPCEDSTCVLWFYDRTKSHRRRWCSMNSCGNRNKVAAFRQRQQSESIN